MHRVRICMYTCSLQKLDGRYFKNDIHTVHIHVPYKNQNFFLITQTKSDGVFTEMQLVVIVSYSEIIFRLLNILKVIGAESQIIIN